MAADAEAALTVEYAGRLVDEAATAVDDARDIGARLRKDLGSVVAAQSGEGRPPTALWTIWAFEFHEHGGGRQKRFTPSTMFGDGTANMPFLRELPDECLAWWADLVEVVTHPRGVARLQHLLVERRHGNVGDRARQSAEGYLALATVPSIDAVNAVRAALDLALGTKQAEMVDEVVARAAALAAQALEEDHPGPGILLGFLDVLIERGGPEHDVDALLRRARTIYRGQPHQEDMVITQQLTRAKGLPAEGRRLWSERVDVWIAAGEAADPLVRVVHFQTAVEHARTSGDRELVERATAKLQTMRLESLGFSTFSVETARPLGELGRILQPITEADDWRTALIHFASLGPFSGDVERNRRFRDELAQEFVFSRLFPPMQLGGDNLPRFRATTEAEQDEYHLVKHELNSLQLFGPVVLEALVRVIAKHSVPTVPELAAHFCANPVVPPRLGMAVGRAFARFWAGDVEAAAFTITPRIEALARNLLIESNEGIYRIQRDRNPGQYPGLRFLLDKLLELGMDPSWHRFVLVVCAHTIGFNIRNELAHGFLDNVGEAETALLLQAAAYLASLGPVRQPEN